MQFLKIVSFPGPKLADNFVYFVLTANYNHCVKTQWNELNQGKIPVNNDLNLPQKGSLM